MIYFTVYTTTKYILTAVYCTLYSVKSVVHEGRVVRV